MLLSKFEEFCDVDGKRVREMCKERGTTVSKVAKELGMCVTTLYGYLDKGRMPSRMAHQMMDAIWDGVPPFYFDIPYEARHERAEIPTITYGWYGNLVEARRQIDIAMKKMEETNA